MSLPFDLPRLSPGLQELSPSARALGDEGAEAAARSLSTLLGHPVTLGGRVLPGLPAARSPGALRAVDLSALPSLALLEVEPALVARLVDLLAGGAGLVEGATELTPIEGAALDLLLAAALEGICSVTAIERALGPRLGAARPEGLPPLAVEVEVAAGEIRGRARLLLPTAALRALRHERAPDDFALGLRLPVSLRCGSAPLTTDELDALSTGDVVLVDSPAGGVETLHLPGGLRALGRRADDLFHVEETYMVDRSSTLPITLEVELARVEISLGDLARLEPGMAIPLGVDRRGLVALRAGERAIARGELVDLDGAIGVRILTLECAP